MHIVSVPGRLVRDPATRRVVDDQPLSIDDNDVYWARLLRDGDVVEVPEAVVLPSADAPADSDAPANSDAPDAGAPAGADADVPADSAAPDAGAVASTTPAPEPQA